MNIREELEKRSGNKCELSGVTGTLHDIRLKPSLNDTLDTNLLVSTTCKEQIENPDLMDSNHWRCLNDSMWSEHKAVQIAAWRMLQRLRGEGWPQDLLDMMYLEDKDLRFAEATGDHLSEDEKIIHRDSNGALLESGDTVTMIKDKDIKGAGSFTLKRGTAIRNISLIHDNSQQIEGRINGSNIIILTKYVRKTGAEQQS